MPGYSAPLLLGSQLTITRGQVLRFDADDLAPRTLIPYEINSIRMVAYPEIETEGTFVGATTDLKGFLKWKFMNGLLPLTDHFVPMWTLTPTRQKISEFGGYYEWRFRKPMLIGPGGRIDAEVQLQANTPNAGSTPTVTVAIAYAGMLRGDLEALPRMTDVPFCSAWDTTVVGYTGTANPADVLRNPLRQTVDVHSLIARIQSDESGLEGDDSSELQVFDPFGRVMNRFGPIQFHAMFPTDTREFPYSGAIEGGQHFAVRLGTPPSATYRPMISFLGSRREILP
jgi:hypothetical protein